MFQVCSFLHCLGGVWNFWNTPPPSPVHIFLSFPPNTWRVSWDKRKESLNSVFLDHRFHCYQAHTHSALHHVDPDSNKSHVLEFYLHLMPCKMSQYSFCLMPQLEVLLVGCWDLGENVKCPMWVVVKCFEKFPRLFAGQLICVNVLPQMSPEWCIYSWRGYFLWVGGKLCLLGIGVYNKERKRAFALKFCKCLVEKKKFEKALFKERFKDTSIKLGHFLPL